MQKTIIAVLGTANVGKSMTLCRLGRRIQSAGGDTKTDISVSEYHAIFSYQDLQVGVQTFGDDLAAVSEGLEDFSQNHCDIIATKRYGATVDHLNQFAATNGFRIVLVAPYEVRDGSIRTEDLKNYGANHLLLIVNDTIAGRI